MEESCSIHLRYVETHVEYKFIDLTYDLWRSSPVHNPKIFIVLDC